MTTAVSSSHSSSKGPDGDTRAEGRTSRVQTVRDGRSHRASRADRGCRCRPAVRRHRRMRGSHSPRPRPRAGRPGGASHSSPSTASAVPTSMWRSAGLRGAALTLAPRSWPTPPCVVPSTRGRAAAEPTTGSRARRSSLGAALHPLRAASAATSRRPVDAMVGRGPRRRRGDGHGRTATCRGPA